MGEMADYALEQSYQNEEDMLEWRLGNMTDCEAYDRGIIDEHGSEYQNNCPIQYPVDNKEDLWFSGGRGHRPQDMPTGYLQNAIMFCKRRGIKTRIVSLMKEELHKRKKQK